MAHLTMDEVLITDLYQESAGTQLIVNQYIKILITNLYVHKFLSNFCIGGALIQKEESPPKIGVCRFEWREHGIL